MKLLALGDTHGRKDWKNIVNQNADKIVFIGDYFDTHYDISANQQIENFKDIITYKRNNINKVVLLFGNHDFHYLRGIEEHYSGFQNEYKFDIQELIHGALADHLLQMCYVYRNFIFTHAGITKTWCKNNQVSLDNIERSINDLFQYQPAVFKFTPGESYNPYGDEICQTPIWVRPKSLFYDKIEGYTHIVGHTTQDIISLGKRNIIINDEQKSTENVIFIDTIGTSGEYLVIEDDIVSIGKIKSL